jgi:hypothetical protein
MADIPNTTIASDEQAELLEIIAQRIEQQSRLESELGVECGLIEATESRIRSLRRDLAACLELKKYCYVILGLCRRKAQASI